MDRPSHARWAPPILALLVCTAAGVRANPYKGVKPGSAEDPPRARAARKADVRVMTWPGFQMRPDGGSRVFVQTSREPEYETRVEKGRFVLLLKGTRIHLRNSRRPLETRYFNSPVTRVKVDRRGRDLAIVLQLRAQVKPRIRSEASPDGRYHYIYLDFPPGQWADGSASVRPAAGEPADEPKAAQEREREAPPPEQDEGGQARDRERPPGMP